MIIIIHNNDNLFINIFEANCYLQVKSKKRTIKTYLQFISIKKTIFKHNNNNNNGKTKVIKLQ